MQSPTLGRTVHFYPPENDPLGAGPLAAVVSWVWSESCVNLGVFDSSGLTRSRTSVFFHQGDTPKPGYGCATWPPRADGDGTVAMLTGDGTGETLPPIAPCSCGHVHESSVVASPSLSPTVIESNIASEHYFTGADGVAGAGVGVAAEFWHTENGHAIVDYSEHTHVGHLTPEKGYERRPLVHRPEQGGPLGQVTFCILELKNGTKVVGVNYGSIDPAKHDAERGKQEARAHAIEQVWPLMGYALRSELARQIRPALETAQA